MRDARRVVGAVCEDLLSRAPQSQLNALGACRTLIGHRAPLDELRRRRHPQRHRTDRRGGGAPGALALERGALGKHVALAPVWLALDLGARGATGARTRGDPTLQAQRPSGGRAEVLAGLGLLPNGVRRAMLRAAAPDSFNLSISSIPGPRTRLDMLGARLDEVYPVVPIGEDQALSIGMLRYHRHLHFGLYADRVALPGAARLPDLLAEQVRALGEARPAEHAHRPVVALRARPAPTPS